MFLHRSLSSPTGLHSARRSDPTGRRTAATLRGPVAALAPALLGLTLLAPVPAAATGCSLTGLGTGEQPWEVAAAADLALVGQGDCGTGDSYLQTADITLAGSWTPISSFSGTFDGDGNTITGLTIDLPAGSAVGMFGTSSGTIRDVHLVDIDVTGQGQVGGLAGNNSGTITDSSVAGTVTGRDAVGGLAGSNSGTIDRSSSTATVTSVASGLSQFGGLVGSNSDTIRYSFATGDVTATGGNSGKTGGLVGHNRSGGQVLDSYARGDVSNAGKDITGGSPGRVGGLVGWGEGGSVTRGFASGGVTDASDAPDPGGLVGELKSEGMSVSDSTWDTDTSGVAEPGPGDGLATSAMTSIATYLDRSWAIEATCDGGGFDPPTAVWGICPSINDGYPYLRWSATASSSSSNGPSTTEPSAPLRDAGTLPSLPAGEASWSRADGAVAPLIPTSAAAGSVTYRDGDATTSVRVTGASGTSVANGVIADANGQLVCEVCADLPVGSVIEVWLFSEPRLVAAHRVTDVECQTFVVPLAEPLDGGGQTATGVHTLQVLLPTAGGMEAFNVGITVGGPVPTTIPAGGGPAPIPWHRVLTLAAGLSLGLAIVGRRLMPRRS